MFFVGIIAKNSFSREINVISLLECDTWRERRSSFNSEKIKGTIMGAKADRDSGISRFVGELLESQGLELYEKWFAHLQGIHPGEKISDLEVRDEVLQELIGRATEGKNLIMTKKDKGLVEDLLNRFLTRAHLLPPA